MERLVTVFSSSYHMVDDSHGFENVSKTQVLIERKMKVMNYFLFLTISFTLIPDYSSLLVVLYFQKVVQVN